MNSKVILCKNYKHSHCKYEGSCNFAHGLDEQKKLPLRNKIYRWLTSDENLGYVKLDDNKLYKELIKMCKVCRDCQNNNCEGGYNCKNGTFNQKYQICYTDLNNGVCNNEDCKCIHLCRDRGLVPYYKQKKKRNTESRLYGIVINDKYIKENYPDESSAGDIDIEEAYNFIYATSDDDSSSEQSIFITN
jgi:hypothetical protein